MDFVSLFHREEKIVGIAVDADTVLGLSLGKNAKKRNGYAIVSHGSMPLPVGTIEEGALVNVRVMGEKLQELWKTTVPSPLGTPFVVASLPSSLFHFQSFTFPGSLSRLQLEDVMGTQIGFALPASTDLMYFDWEEVPPRLQAHHEIFFVWARRSVIDPYLAAFRDAHFIPVAIEPHYVSILRTINLTKEGLRAIAILQKREITIVVYDRGAVRFVRVTPWERHALSRSAATPEEARSPSAERIAAITIDEIRRTLLFYSSAMEGEIPPATFTPLEVARPQGPSGAPARARPLTGFTLLPLFGLPHLVTAIANELSMEHIAPTLAPTLQTIASVKEEHRMHPIFGAAERTLIPRGLDTMVSIMPVGTEILYRRTKALAFTRFLHDFSTAFGFYLALLFALMAVGFFYFVNQEQMRMKGQNNFTLPQQLGAWERDARALNEGVAALQKVHSEQPAWSALFRSVMAALTPGITITSFGADRSSPIVTIVGKAENLSALLAFKKSLEVSDLFDRIDLPLSVFSQEGVITFSLPLKVKEYTKLLFPTS